MNIYSELKFNFNASMPMWLKRETVPVFSYALIYKIVGIYYNGEGIFQSIISEKIVTFEMWTNYPKSFRKNSKSED